MNSPADTRMRLTRKVTTVESYIRRDFEERLTEVQRVLYNPGK